MVPAEGRTRVRDISDATDAAILNGASVAVL
jgi:hypothetical protein